MGTHGSGPAETGSGQKAGGSGAIGIGSSLARTIMLSRQFKVGEGSNRSAKVKSLLLWLYERIVKNGGRLFLGKLDGRGFCMDFLGYWNIREYRVTDGVLHMDHQ